MLGGAQRVHPPTRTDREGYFCLPSSSHTEGHTLPGVDGPYFKEDNDPADADCSNHLDNVCFTVPDHNAYAAYFFKEFNF